MKFLLFILISAVIIIAAIIFIKKSNSTKAASPSGVVSPEMRPRNNKRKFKMMTYQEALEASKQFIYDITRAVMQKFTPDSQRTLLELGKKLVKNGVTYLHVIDVAALSAEKEKQLSHMQQKEGPSLGRH